MTAKICPHCHAAIPAGAPGGFCPACVLRGAEETAGPAPHGGPPLAEVRAAFPQLEVQALIGQGGMGFVYKARQPSLDRTVALKILAPALGRDPAFAERFAREARVLAKLSHPNIITVFEHGVTQPSSPGAQPFYYLLMEYVDGVNLRQAMRAGRFTPEQALSVVPGICDALQAAHAQGIWHRDIKPENILLDARGGLKIADFGIARLVGDPARDFTITVTGAALGSAAYMAPEQHERPHDVDHRADIYSLGVVIYEMLTGELPLGRFPAPSQRAAVDARIDEIVLRTLEKERALRQQSAEEVKTEVTQATSYPLRAHPAAARSWTPLILSQMAVVAGIVLFAGAAALTHGSTQNTLLTISLVPFVLGLVGLILFRRREPPRMRKRHFSMGLVAGALLAGITVAVVALIEYQNTARALARANLAEEHEKLAALKAAAERQAKPPAADASAVSMLEPAVPVEEVFQIMNELANAGKHEEIQKHIAAGAKFSAGSQLPGRDVPSAELANLIAGKILRCRNEVVGVNDPLRRPYRSITAELTTPNASRTWIFLMFRADEGAWKLTSVGPPNYEATCRFELRPPAPAEPRTVLLHYLKESEFVTGPGESTAFQFRCYGNSPDTLVVDLNRRLANLRGRLEKDGLGPYFKILAEPAVPTVPFGFE